MTIDDRTSNFNLPLPHVSNIDTVDVTRLRSALAILDTEVAERLTTPQVNALLTVYASQAYVNAQIAALVNSAPGVLDTLSEIAAALGNDASFASTMASQLSSLNTAVSGKQATLTMASQAEMEAGSLASLRGMTPLGVAQAIAVLGKAKITLSDRTSNTILGLADHSRYVRVTSGTFTQTFSAAATLGAGWYCWIENDGDGDVTLDPNGSETIDGLTSFVMYPNEARLIFCNGTSFESLVMRCYAKTFTSSGTFTKPPGYRMHDVWMWGGGGSGARVSSGSTNRIAQGGVGGTLAILHLPNAGVAASESVIVGAGGAAVTTGDTLGNAGGSSSFGLFVGPSSAGGNRSASNGSYSGSPNSQSGTGGNIDDKAEIYNWTYGVITQIDQVYAAGRGGSASYISGAFTAGPPGTSMLGGNGGNYSTTSAAAGDGVAPGGGGGGNPGGGNSGAGARGEVRVYGVI